MTLNPRIWHPIAVGLSAINLAGAGFAIAQNEAMHASIHAVLALACGWWAYRLRQGPARVSQPDRLEALEGDLTRLRQELVETQERLDFAERMLAQGKGQGRVGPER